MSINYVIREKEEESELFTFYEDFTRYNPYKFLNLNFFDTSFMDNPIYNFFVSLEFVENF